MLGYWGDEEKTRETIDAARWMHTGDLAVIDEQGFATIVGRAKNMVIRGGESIYPRKIEEFLYRHPKVLDVQCVGVPDDHEASHRDKDNARGARARPKLRDGTLVTALVRA